MDGAGAGGAGQDPWGFERWLARLQVDDAARARARRHWLRTAAEEDASLAGVLLDLAEREVSVTLTTASDRRHHGTIAVVGVDFVALRGPTNRYVLVRRCALTAIRPSPDRHIPIGDREVTSQGTLVEVLIALAAERLTATLVLGDQQAITGEVRSIGQDVVVLRVEGDPPGTVFVALARVDEVTLDGPPDQSLGLFESG